MTSMGVVELNIITCCYEIPALENCLCPILTLPSDERSVFQARLCLIILICITEDQFANAFLHDPNMTFPVTLHRAVSVVFVGPSLVM